MPAIGVGRDERRFMQTATTSASMVTAPGDAVEAISAADRLLEPPRGWP